LKVTVPGPLTLLQATVRWLPAGNPSSVAVPFNVAVFGSVMVRSGPALTTGAWFCGITVTVASAIGRGSWRHRLKLTTYVPATLNEAVVIAAFGLLNVTVPGPLTLLQVTVR